jgi:hypothetical protein
LDGHHVFGDGSTKIAFAADGGTPEVMNREYLMAKWKEFHG